MRSIGKEIRSFDRRNLAGRQRTAKYAPRRKRGGRRPFSLGQEFCFAKPLSAAALFAVPKRKCFDHADTEGGFAKQTARIYGGGEAIPEGNL